MWLVPGIPLVPQILKEILHFPVAKWKHRGFSLRRERGAGAAAVPGKDWGFSAAHTLRGEPEVVDLGEHLGVKVRRHHLSLSGSLLALAEL